jgi:hypothetical protein
MAAVTPAAAQNPRPERPFRGLFGSGTLDLEQSLVANGSVGGGWDNNVVADALFGGRPRAGTPSTNADGAVGQASGSLNYSARLSSLTLDASGGTTVHYYPSLGSEFMRRYFGNAGASARVTRYLSANLTVSYMPYSLNSLYPIASAIGASAALPDADFASSLEHYFSYSAGAVYSRQLSRRTSLSADYSYRMRDSSSFAPQYTSHAAGGGLRFDVGRGLGLRTGYRYVEADYGGTSLQKFRNHHIDVGVDYNRALSFSRRTTLSFSTGTSAISRPEETGLNTRFRATGRAQLVHEMGRSWNASAGYARGVYLDERWLDVVTSDSVTASLAGLLTRRIQFQSGASASTGRTGSSNEGGFNSYYGNASLGYALNRHVNLGLTYAYYSHRFASGVALPSDFVNRFNRHSVRASVSVWAPLFQRTRRSNATR